MSRSNARDEIILSFSDGVLRQSDLKILSGPHFLNDRIMEFYSSHLSSSTPASSKDVLLVPPVMAFWISNCPDSNTVRDVTKPLNLAERQLVLFPVNDNDNVEVAEGGSHWSLLAYHRGRNLFVHHDSLGGSNKRPARQLYRAVAGLMGTAAAAVEYMEANDSPRQQNGYDCGLFVLATARAISGWYNDNKSREDIGDDSGCGGGLWFSTVKEQVKPVAVGKLRVEILDLIRSMM